jgi:hypothetical protein
MGGMQVAVVEGTVEVDEQSGPLPIKAWRLQYTGHFSTDRPGPGVPDSMFFCKSN